MPHTNLQKPSFASLLPPLWQELCAVGDGREQLESRRYTS